MKMSSGDVVRFPKCYERIRFWLPRVGGYQWIVDAMQTAGQLTPEQFRRALSWGTNPLLRITPLRKAYGQFVDGKGSQEILIDIDLAEDFERSPVPKMAGGWYMLEVTVLHEMTHWGDDADGKDKGGEEGNWFERLAFGRVMRPD